MRSTKKISEVIQKNPSFKLEWSRGDIDTIFYHPKFGKISHHAVCSESGQPIYDLPILDLVENVNILPFLTKGGKIFKIFYMKSQRPTLGKVLVEFPGGCVEPNEAPETSALRELKEESPLKPVGKPIFLGKVILNHALCNKAESYLFALEVKEVEEINHEEIRENRIIFHDFISPKDFDKILLQQEETSCLTASLWTFFKAKFEKDFY